MPRYLKTQVLFRRTPNQQELLMGIKTEEERRWAPAIIDLDCVQTCNPSWIFENYDENAPGCPEPNCTEVLLRDGTDFSVNIPFTQFSAYLTGEKR